MPADPVLLFIGALLLLAVLWLLRAAGRILMWFAMGIARSWRIFWSAGKGGHA